MTGGLSSDRYLYTGQNLYQKNADDARSVLLSAYGEKLGSEAYFAVKNAR
jgi:hypothetical protein